MDELGNAPTCASCCSAATAGTSRPAPTSHGSDRRPRLGRGERARQPRHGARPSTGSTGCPLPTVALVQGGCFGGGTGIIAACDVVIAADNAMFSIAEVRWGLTAAIILPQLSDAISRAAAAPLCADRRALRRRRRLSASASSTRWCRYADSRAAGENGRHACWRTDPGAMAETKADRAAERVGRVRRKNLRCARREPCRQAPLGRSRRRPRLLRREAARQVVG